MPKKHLLIKNKVREYCDREGISKNQFLSKALSSPLQTDTGRALTVDTATRIYNGETSITLPTAGLIAAALGVEIGDLFEVE
jgi:transcriptional regulator with XRE-family HTH domain